MKVRGKDREMGRVTTQGERRTTEKKGKTESGDEA